MQKIERIHWAKQGLNLCNREKSISNRKMVMSPTLPIYKEFECIDSIFIASVLRKDKTGSIILNGIGTICHELSHCFGLPDTYDSDSGNYGTQRWDLMGVGVHNNNGFTPAGYTAFDKIYCNWQTPIVLKDKTTIVNGMRPMSEGGEIYVIPNDAHSREFYTLENRQQTGWDEKLPGHGMLIMHVDYNESLFEANIVNRTDKGNNDHERCAVVLADNDTTTQNYPGDLYPYGTNNSFTNTSVPSSFLYHKNVDGTNLLSKPITDIMENPNGTMNFTFHNHLAHLVPKSGVKKIKVDVAGTLANYIPENEMLDIDSLEISGNLNGSDFKLIRKMAGREVELVSTYGSLVYLDLSNANIVDGGEQYHYEVKEGTVKDVFPAYSLHMTFIHKVILPNSVKYIGKYAFAGCTQFEEIVYGSSNLVIGEAAFAFCSPVKKMVIGNSVKSIGQSAFYKMPQLEEIILGENVDTIWASAFRANQNMKNVVLNNSLKSIRGYAFENCPNLCNIVFPSSIGQIMNNAFAQNSNLQTITSKILNPFYVFDNTFDDVIYQNGILYVPYGTKEKYMKVNGWKNFKNIMEMDAETVVTVKDYSRQYGDTNPLFEYTVEGEPLVGEPMIVCNANEKSSVGEYTVSIERGTVENVNVKFVNGKLDVKKAPLTISTGTYTIKQGEALPEYTLTYSGFKNDETCSVLLKQPIVECDATPLSEAGEYPIRIYGAEAQNYEIDYVNGMLIIDEKPELAKLQLPLGNGENMCFWEPGFGSEWYIVKGKIDIRFTDEGIFYLHKYIIDGNQYDGFVIVFEKPVGQSGLSVRASNNTYEIPVGTSSIEGQFRRNTWDDFSLRAEVGQDVTIKNVLLKNINGEYENANYVIHHMPDQTLHWNNGGKDYSSAINGTLYTNKNLEILNTYSGNVNLEKGDYIGGAFWSAKRDAEKPMIYKLVLTESLSSESALTWRVQTVSGKTLYFPIDGDDLEYEISVDDDVADCRIINQEGSLLWFQIEGVYLENGETTGVMQARKDLPVDGKVYNLQGQKVSPVGRGLYIRNNKKIIRK